MQTTTYSNADLVRLVSDLSSELENTKNEIARLKINTPTLKQTAAVTSGGFNYIEPTSILTIAATGAAAYSSYAVLNLAAYVPAGTKDVLLELDYSTNRSGGSSADSDFRLEWLVDGRTTPYKDRYYNEHELVDDANYNVTHQVQWPINASLDAQYRYYDDDTFQDYTVTLIAYR